MGGNRTGRIIVALLSIAVGVLYLLNPTAGLLEIIPDNLPYVGNLDEAGATALVIWGIGLLRGSGESASPELTDKS